MILKYVLKHKHSYMTRVHALQKSHTTELYGRNQPQVVILLGRFVGHDKLERESARYCCTGLCERIDMPNLKKLSNLLPKILFSKKVKVLASKNTCAGLAL